MAHVTRDAAYEEIWHLVHDYGIKPTRQAMIAEMRRVNDVGNRERLEARGPTTSRGSIRTSTSAC